MSSRNIIRNLFERRQSQAKTGSRPFYHGTDPKNLKTILSKGLIPMPKEKRAWAADTGTNRYNASRESFGGTYVTRDLMTAISSAPVKNKLIVIMELQPRTLDTDEDNFTFSLAGSVLNEEYAPNILIPFYTIKMEPHSPVVKKYFEEYLDAHKYFFSNYIGDRYNNENPNKYTNYINSKLFPFWLALINRQASYLLKENYSGTRAYESAANAYIDLYPEKAQNAYRIAEDLVEQYPPLPLEQAEEAFREQQRALITALRDVTQKAEQNAKGMFKGRDQHGVIFEPIGYSGANRITHIILMKSSIDLNDKILKIVYGNLPLPKDFVSQFIYAVTGQQYKDAYVIIDVNGNEHRLSEFE